MNSSKTSSHGVGSFPHMAIFQECDNVLQDNMAFRSQSMSLIETFNKSHSQKSSLTGIDLSGKIMKWRSKKNNVNLSAMYTEIATKLLKSEEKMKKLIEIAVKDCSSFVLQAKYVRLRLKSCINYNHDLSSVDLFTYNEASAILEAVRDRERALKSMLLFHDEVDRIRKITDMPATNSGGYIPWDMRVSSSSDGSGDGYGYNNHRLGLKTKASIHKRLGKVVKMREFLDRNLKSLENKYESLRSVLSHCRLALVTLENTVLKVKAAPPSLMSSPASSDRDREVDQYFLLNDADGVVGSSEFFDHNNCSDCSCVYTMANECVMNLATSQHVAEESTKRLQKIMEFKENNKALCSALNKIDWGNNL